MYRHTSESTPTLSAMFSGPLLWTLFADSNTSISRHKACDVGVFTALLSYVPILIIALVLEFIQYGLTEETLFSFLIMSCGFLGFVLGEHNFSLRIATSFLRVLRAVFFGTYWVFVPFCGLVGIMIRVIVPTLCNDALRTR